MKQINSPSLLSPYPTSELVYDIIIVIQTVKGIYLLNITVATVSYLLFFSHEYKNKYEIKYGNIDG